MRVSPTRHDRRNPIFLQQSTLLEKPIRIGYSTLVVTIHRQFGFRFAILTDDHEPPHVHVQGDGEMKVVIRGAGGLPEMTYTIGFKAKDRRRIMDVVLERQEEFLARWDEIHGS